MFDACALFGFPYPLGLAILWKESRGRNVYGSDSGGAFAGRGEVTEANYQEFLALVKSGHRSNGVGPMQITYAPYHTEVAPRDGFRLWVPGDNIHFGVRILGRAFATQMAKGKSVRDAFWEVSRAWNGGSNPERGRAYADDAVTQATGWFGALRATAWEV